MEMEAPFDGLLILLIRPGFFSFFLYSIAGK